MNFRLSHIDDSWSLFLDRDGVINRHIPDDYVKSIAEFEMLPGVPGSIARLAQRFGWLFVATNQQGVGKGLYSLDDVGRIHAYMTALIEREGGRIDRIYVAPQLDSEDSPMRKPGIGMALQAKRDFPQIELARSIMVGDSISDMYFGRRAGMHTVWIGGTSRVPPDNTLVDAIFPSLVEFADALDEAAPA